MTELLGNLDDLVAQVRRRAEQRALVLEAAGEEQARRLLEDAAARARAVTEAVAAAAAATAAEARRQALAGAELARRRRRLEAREARLDRVWAGAARELDRLAGAEAWPATLAGMARAAAATLGGGAVTITVDAGAHPHLRPDDVALWAEPGGPALRLDPAPLPHGRGLIARAGRASVDATVETRLAQARERLRGEVAGLLGAAGLLEAAEGGGAP